METQLQRTGQQCGDYIKAQFYRLTLLQKDISGDELTCPLIDCLHQHLNTPLHALCSIQLQHMNPRIPKSSYKPLLVATLSCLNIYISIQQMTQYQLLVTQEVTMIQAEYLNFNFTPRIPFQKQKVFILEVSDLQSHCVKFVRRLNSSNVFSKNIRETISTPKISNRN